MCNWSLSAPTSFHHTHIHIHIAYTCAERWDQLAPAGDSASARSSKRIAAQFFASRIMDVDAGGRNMHRRTDEAKREREGD